MSGNGLSRYPAGRFPAAKAGDRAPAIALRPFSYRLPADPRPARRPTCVGLGRIGVLLGGAALVAPLREDGGDAQARRILDGCGGRTGSAGLYHRYTVSPCAPDPGRGHSRLLGYAVDGFGIYGPRGPGGRRLRTRDLDACHGHTHEIVWDGRRVRRYHYHATSEFPYVLGCFRGTPVPPQAVPAPAPPPGAAPPPAQPPEAPVAARVTSSPALEPPFDPGVADYAMRCSDAQAVSLNVTPGSGQTASVDGAAPVAAPRSASVVLNPGQAVRWQIGDAAYRARCLPPDFPGWTFSRTAASDLDFFVAGPTLGGARYLIVFDRNGVPVWWLDPPGSPTSLDGKILSDGTFAYGWSAMPGYVIGAQDRYDIRRLDGTLVRSLSTVGTPTDRHDLQLLPNGNYLLMSYRERQGQDLSAFGGPASAGVLDGEVQEVTPGGAVAWSWNSASKISLDEAMSWWALLLMGPPAQLPSGGTGYDHFHLNSHELDGSTLVISARHLDAVYGIDRTTGDVVWKLGGTQTPASLQFVGDPIGAFSGQHDARILPDGTLTVYDNGTLVGRAPRAVRYRLDLPAGTATLVEQISDSDVGASGCCGSARKLAGGNWLVGWGMSPRIGEYREDGTRVTELVFSAGFGYRANPVPPGAVSAQQLRDGMDAMHPRGP